MWTLTNNSPFAAERAWVRDKNGAEVWLVAVKGTYLILPDGTTKLSENQEEVCLEPKFLEDNGNSNLLYDSDMVHTKRNTDIVIHGHAYAPKGKPIQKVDVNLKISNINKTIRVFGERVWKRSMFGIKMTKPKPFTKMPLLYTRAFGGMDCSAQDPAKHDWDVRNPIGLGFAKTKNFLLGKEAPNIEDPNKIIRRWKHRPRPAGFAPVPGHWVPRVKFGGTYDENWEKNRLPLLPEDFDERFNQCVPEDQQTEGFLKGDEWLELKNLTPGGFLKFQIPRITLGFNTRFADGDSQLHQGFLHTIIVEPNVPRVMLVWHTQLPCHHKVLKLLTTQITVKKRINLSERKR